MLSQFPYTYKCYKFAYIYEIYVKSLFSFQFDMKNSPLTEDHGTNTRIKKGSTCNSCVSEFACTLAVSFTVCIRLTNITVPILQI